MQLNWYQNQVLICSTNLVPCDAGFDNFEEIGEFSNWNSGFHSQYELRLYVVACSLVVVLLSFGY
jgi:hypothetical protein